ncbi:lysophospholipase [Streptomyces sp. NPDC047072]|uniref:alpha/beta hydrolase n=1 Tax=Streptomyces sp. NPDC047072 TaxID=3154809 RepID=UPI0033F97153
MSSFFSWDEPEGLAARGTLIVLAGRGEHGGVYERFGRRLAFDAYRVRALGDPSADPSVLDEAAKLLADDSLPGPKVLVGSDTGARYAAALAAEGTAGVDAVILAGLPTADGAPGGREDAAGTGGESPVAIGGESPVGIGGKAQLSTGGEARLAIGEEAEADVDWEVEVTARTACPTHQGRLTNDPDFRRGVLFDTPADLPELRLDRVTVPVLALHGRDDTISPLDRALDAYAGARTVVLNGGRHDVLNDALHRTVAATIVLFLERLRLSPELTPIAEEPA